MSSRFVAQRGGKSLASVSASGHRQPSVQISLFPRGQRIRNIPLAMRRSSPLHQALVLLPKQPQRSFSTLQRIRDVFLQRPNPVTFSLRQETVEPMAMEDMHKAAYNGRKPITDLPDFSAMKPYHFEPAARQVQETYESALLEFEKTLESSELEEYSDVIPELDRIEAPIRASSQIHFLLHHVKQDPTLQNALEAASRQLKPHHKTSRVIMEALRGIESNLLQKQHKHESDRRHLWAVQFLLSEHEKKSLNLEENEMVELENIRISLAETEGKFARKPDGLNQKRTGTREKLEDIYSILSLRSREANILGFENYVDMTFQSRSRMASSVDDVRAIHKELVPRVMPVVSSEAPVNIVEEANLISYLTLDGVLGGVFGLSRALFGVTIHEETDAARVKGWHPDVRLFHVYDEDSDRYLGSFYLDPYRRQMKTDQVFVSPVLNKCGSSVFPVVCISIDIRPPVWSHLPTAVTLDDARSIFHEFGHALSYLLCQEKVGGVFGAQNLELDVTEVLPQFMEHWLYQESVLQSLAQLSQADEAIPKETIDMVMQQRTHDKAHEIMHRVLLSELEFEIFSNLEDESVVSVLKRIAETYRAHDPLHKSDIWPLLEVFEDSVRGEQVTTYRYMWSEVMSADLFGVFVDAGIANEEEIRRLGRLFRETFLEPGASLNSTKGFRKFRGRDMSVDPLFRLYGY